MSKALDAYWEREIGKELTCKCGRVHYKERRPKSNTCKECLADDFLKKQLISITKLSRKVYRLIGVWECSECGVIKPNSEYHGKEVRGKCKCCDNARKLKAWKENDAYRERKLKANKEWVSANRERRNKWVREYQKTYTSPSRPLNGYKIGDCSHIQVIKCADCGELELKRYSNKVRCLCINCYSRRCSRDWHYQHALNNNGLNGVIEKECLDCGAEVEVVYGTKERPLCAKCRLIREAKQRRLRAASERRRRRGGRVKGVRYDPYDVFKRDRWRCYICGIKTQKKDIYADNAAEIDHVVPLSKGGKDIPSNVRCCCRKCNIDKADKLIPVVGNLFCQVETG